jgi:CheY-like chemotaxis protein
MPKILLVEDDNNLREIFEMRLKAEGYDTVTAGNGEEALVIAMKERPDLIIADVMMPKLSGFEMLETLRAAPEMANTKAIMMTALGQAEDRARGEQLGVIKYLVKSQVTLEDFVRVVREVVSPEPTTEGVYLVDASQTPANFQQNNQEREPSMQEDNSQVSPAPANDGAAANTNTPNPIVDGAASPALTPEQPSTAQEQSAVQGQIDSFVSSAPAGDPAAASAPLDASAPTAPAFGSDSAASAPADPAATDTSSEPSIPVSTPPADPAPEAPAESGDGSGTPAAPAV